MAAILMRNPGIAASYTGPKTSDGAAEALHIAQIHSLAQGRQGIARGHKLMRHIALEMGGGDAAHHSIPLYFLSTIELMPPRNTAGVEVAEPLNVLLDGGD